MTYLLEYQLSLVDWGALRGMVVPAPDTRIPDAVRDLVLAQSDGEADDAYWRLDNHVVVQGQLFEAAVPLVPVLLAALAGPLSTASRVRVADLLVEISCGGADESELALGNVDLGRACRSATAAGVWLIFEMLLDHDARLRERALQIIYAVDEDRTHVATMLAHLHAEDPDASVRDAAAELTGHMPGVIYDDATA